ncbi:MAG: spore germination protein [Firmicutes bacterium]|nr:spore germination protein [Bacillota bacterium]
MRKFVRPKSLLEADKPRFASHSRTAGTPVSPNLSSNIEQIRKICGPENSDIIIREFGIPIGRGFAAALFFVEGLTDRFALNLGVIQPLQLSNCGCTLADGDDLARGLDASGLDIIDYIVKYLLGNSQAKRVTSLDEAIDMVMTGESAIFVDGVAEAIVTEVKGWANRGIQEPQSELTIRGPREGFSEVVRFNTALLRRRIRNPALRMDPMKVGALSATDVLVVYIQDLTNERLVEEVKRRISEIDIDYLPEAGYIEQFIEDNPFSPFPQVLATERPDRLAAALAEGHVGILVDGTPVALITPSFITDIYEATEDYYERFLFGSARRLLRIGATLLALLLPALYIAIVTFHQEMIPTPLALAFASARQRVPFPALVEALLMEVALELIREAGVRLPSPVGQTVGIVGALLLGDAAVQANLVSPIMVIVVALTGLASFATPYHSGGLAIRLLRFPLMVAGAAVGLYGVAAGIIAISIHLTLLTSLGVPYLSPFLSEPYDYKDVIVRAPLWTMRFRPRYLRPYRLRRQAGRGDSR